MSEVGQVRALRPASSFDGSALAALPYLLVLSPLVYSFDNDPYRAWEAGFVGIVIIAIAISAPFRGRWTAEMTTLVAYGGFLILQQLFIPSGNIGFGAKYAISMATVFIPHWIMSSMQWRLGDFSTVWHRAIELLAAVVVLNFGASYVLGAGEISPGGFFGPRVFGYLGDSFTPVLVFLFLYFVFQYRHGWSAAMLAALALTQGKAAAFTLFFALGLCVFLSLRGTARVVLVFVSSILLLAMGLSIVTMVLSNGVIEYSVVTRLVSYERGLRLFETYPVFGVGINQSMNGAIESGQALARLANIGAFDSANGQIDNAFLRTMAETGIFGLAVLLALCVILIRHAQSSIRIVWDAPPSRVRALSLASGIWVISFILTYQFVGWFEAGHPQMTWLLLISAIGHIASQAYDRAVTGAPRVAKNSS